ncbi:MAG: putative DNA binding domain-containing protein, partial [Muribaculaceae bacterium]|nr:putative DNA binding domain-containing protein [Muribaculaceae bacterium]
MTSPEEVLRLLSDIESDRVERTVSTTKTDKFGQAICAFANDLPNHNRPGYLIIGVDDKTGKVDPDVRITDQLLQNLAAIKTDGNLQPQVSLTVEKVTLPDGDVAVVTVQPCPFTPVRYEGRIWIRNGPRKCIAGEADEKRLLEKRTSRMLTFDALPCLDASVDDLDTAAFRQIYLPKAFPEDVLKTDNRSVEQQLQALGYYNAKFNCPTYAGIIMFGKYPERFMPGCYVQYVRFKGLTRAGEIKSEYKFSGNLVKILSQLDTFVDASITNRRPVPVSALREEMRVDYPHWATRELLMNAICHRDYEGNGPVQFYQYDDRIEIMNPGGLYGKVTPENFPYVNDYRNGVVAEGMKVLGFVNRYSRGVQTVQDELRGNGNGEADFKLHLGTAFLVIERISSLVSQKTNQQAGQEAGQQTGQKTNQQAGQETNQEIGRKENDALLQDVDKEKNTKEWIEKVPEVREKTNQQTGKKAGQQTGQKTGQQTGQHLNQQTGHKTGQQ